MVQYFRVSELRDNIIEFEIFGRNAMFRDPENYCRSLLVPTFSAVRGIMCSIYWKPTFLWVPDEVRIMNPICTEKYSVRTHSGKFELVRLADVRYQIRAHFVWNEERPDLIPDRNEDKHFRMALRSLHRGGRFPVYLGTADCPAEVIPGHFGHGSGHYDHCGGVRTEQYEMVDGVIRFEREPMKV